MRLTVPPLYAMRRRIGVRSRTCTYNVHHSYYYHATHTTIPLTHRTYVLCCLDEWTVCMFIYSSDICTSSEGAGVHLEKAQAPIGMLDLYDGACESHVHVCLGHVIL